ncbi:MAG: patatin-like phospholipase family protein [Woeseiaceae bacterium]|nr:patatin-like phospholipase family protein [Woeseiaceae bacterium]
MTIKTHNLCFYAGPKACDRLRREGFSPGLIGSLAGASGGAKWLVLSQLDRVVVDRLLPEFRAPVHMIGSSIGAWRFACYAQANPGAAIDRFERAYLEQSYSENPDTTEITRKSRDILDHVLPSSAVADVLAHPALRLNVMTVRSRTPTASDSRPLLGAGLLAAMTANAVSRRALSLFFERGLFYDPREEPPFFSATGFRLHRIPLSAQNLADAIMASGSIPMVLSGVRDIVGAPAGMYRDGGVIDYHLDLPTTADDRLTLYLHFFNWLKPGWFDRWLRWRRVDAKHFDNTLLICPSPAFIAALPGGKVPDRTDFVRWPQPERVRIWRAVVERCRQLAEEFERVLDEDELPRRVQPLETL